MRWKWWSQEEIASWPPEHKRCRRCNRVKRFKLFHKGNKKSLFALSNECKVCRKLKSKKEWAAKSPQQRLYDAARSRAWARDIKFDLSIEDIQVPTECPVFKVPFGKGELAPSLDRFYPELGYTKGNVFVVSKRANVLKNNAQSWELRAVAQWIEAVRNGQG
jgi:hypothetical protein